MSRAHVAWFSLAPPLLLMLVSLGAAPPPAAADKEEPSPEPPTPGRFVEMKTSKGTIKIELFAKQAPASVKNFLAYVDSRHYDRTVFHRVFPGFVIQGGGYETGFNAAATAADLEAKKKKTRPPVKNEAKNGLQNKRGTIAVARVSASPDSGTNQFYINTVDNPHLDQAAGRDGWCVFGKVVSGMDVVDAIARVPTKNHVGHSNVPVDEVVILSARRVGK